MNFINVKVKKGNQPLLTSKFLILEPYAPATTRRFTFTDNIWEENVLEGLSFEGLTVSVFYFTKKDEWSYYTEFKINVFEYQEIPDNEWSVSGLVNQDDTDKPYQQGITDIFKTWQDNKHLDWFSLTEGDHLKSAYFSACLFNSGISETMLEKDVYEIDMSLVMEKQDFIYLASLAFMGDRGYMGYNLYTFSDCLLTLFHKRGWFDGVKVKFLNLGSISEKVRDLYIEIKEIFLKFKFDVIEA